VVILVQMPIPRSWKQQRFPITKPSKSTLRVSIYGRVCYETEAAAMAERIKMFNLEILYVPDNLPLQYYQPLSAMLGSDGEDCPFSLLLGIMCCCYYINNHTRTIT